MTYLTNLPPELRTFSRIMDGQPPQVRELFQYALAILMIEDGKAEIIEWHTIDERRWVTIRTAAGELFSLVKPDVRGEHLAEMIDTAREIVREERGGRGR